MIVERLRSDGEEILDREGLSDRGRRILADLDRWNRLAGWYRFHVARVREHWRSLGSPTPLRVLDVGTGPGGLLAALADWTAREGIPAELVGVDRSPAYVAMARERVGGRAVVIEGDATALAVEDGAFHVATSTLMMHHLPGGVRRAMVAEMGRVARSVYLFDVELTLYGMLGMPLFYVVAGGNPDSLHDGLLSIRRGSTRDEFAELCRPLPVRVRRVFPSALCTVPAR